MWKYIFGRKGLFQPFDSKGMKYNCNSKPPRCIIFNGTVILEFRAKASFTIWYDDICQGPERWKIWGIPGNPWHNQREIHNLQSKVTSLYAVKKRGGIARAADQKGSPQNDVWFPRNSFKVNCALELFRWCLRCTPQSNVLTWRQKNICVMSLG